MKIYSKKITMQFYTFFLVMFVLLINFSSCKKSDIISKVNAIFPYNTEWVGTMDGSGFEYRPPCSLKFNSDNTFTMYAKFVLLSNSLLISKDSITGVIQKIDTLPDSRIRITTDITTSFNGVATKYLYITDKKEIQAVNASLSLETFQLSLFPAKDISVAGDWSGPAWKGGMAYPDLNTIYFLPNGPTNVPVTGYSKNGEPVRNAAEATSGLLLVIYRQAGARVYFAGYSEERPVPGYGGTIIPYFGVMLPTGDKMMVDSRSDKARLPNYLDTNEPYGPNGTTPTIIKK